MSFKYTIGTLEHNTPCRGLPGSDNEGRVASWWGNIANVTGWDNYNWYFVGAFVNGVKTVDLDVVISPKGEWDYAEVLSVLTNAQQLALNEDLMLDIYATEDGMQDLTSGPNGGPAADYYFITNHQGWQWEDDGKVLRTANFTADQVTSPIEGLYKYKQDSPSKANVFPSCWNKLDSGVYTKTHQLCSEYFQQ